MVDLKNTVSAEIGVALEGSGYLYTIHQSMWADLGALAGQGVTAILTSVRNLVQNSAVIIQSPYDPIPLPAASNGGTQGAVNTTQVQAIVRNQILGYLGGRGAGQF